MAKRVFFSFHYRDVIDFRANVVRKCWVVKPEHEEAGFFDASLWEQAKRTDDESLRRLINSGLENTSVTTVLIGADTFSRRWVRYEIMKSLFRGNKLIGVHINSIPCKNRQTKSLGVNPYDYLGIRFNTDGTAVTLFEWQNSQWISYSDLQGWTLKKPNTQSAGKFVQLSTYATTYDWVANDGYNNFGEWVA